MHPTSNQQQVQEEHVASHLEKSGWPAETTGYLLSAPSWKDRMLMAWCLAGGDSRKEALELDYQSIQNYWPNLDFLRPDWTKEVLQLAADPSNALPAAIECLAGTLDELVKEQPRLIPTKPYRSTQGRCRSLRRGLTRRADQERL